MLTASLNETCPSFLHIKMIHTKNDKTIISTVTERISEQGGVEGCLR